MKKIIIILLLFVAFTSTAQIKVYTLGMDKSEFKDLEFKVMGDKEYAVLIEDEAVTYYSFNSENKCDDFDLMFIDYDLYKKTENFIREYYPTYVTTIDNIVIYEHISKGAYFKSYKYKADNGLYVYVLNVSLYIR